MERLPKIPTGRISVGEAAGEIVTVLVTLGFLVFAATLTTTDATGSPARLLAPSFTAVWLPILLVAIAMRGVVHLRAYNTGRWTRWLAVYYALLQVAFGVLLVTLARTGVILNPSFGEAIGWPDLHDGQGPVMLALALGTVLATGWEIVRILLRARQAQGSGPLVEASSTSA
jgi:membrane-bound metal-dependent hydrolase YbcI (DUF457 family)